MKRLIKNERGVALMMVLGSLLIISTLIVEFAYNTHISYELASAERDRLKAYYLARSAFNLLKLEIKFENDLRTRFANVLKDLPGSGITSDPFCKQIPLSTGLLKGIASGALTGGGGEEGAQEDSNDEGDSEEVPTEAQDFLSFDGDFEANCDAEEKKINLNVFRADPLQASGVAGGLNLYDSQKELLVALLLQKEFEPIFKGKPDEVRKVVNSIADWADKDDRINDAPGIAGSQEDSLYSGPEFHYKVKNGKYMTPGEILLVAGVGDELFDKLLPQVTVYGDQKINLCQATDEMIMAFVGKIVQTSPGLIPINPEDDQRRTAIVDSVRLTCEDPAVQPQAVATTLVGSIGGGDPAAVATQITTRNRFYRLEATGLVNESQVKITGVLDTSGTNPNLWKTLYFRVE